jgi:hypothetical protein
MHPSRPLVTRISTIASAIGPSTTPHDQVPARPQHTEQQRGDQRVVVPLFRVSADEAAEQIGQRV